MPDRGPIPGAPALLDFVADTTNSIGVRMLRSLGWREGQGIGPRLSAREKKKRRQLMKKRALASAVDSDSDHELPDEYSLVTLAPDDAGIADVFGLSNIRINTFGLGYVPLSQENILGRRNDERSVRSFNVVKEKKTFSVQGQAFGVGAFEEEDDDIYSQVFIIKNIFAL